MDGKPYLVDFLPYDVMGKRLELSRNHEEQGSRRVEGFDPRVATEGPWRSKKRTWPPLPMVSSEAPLGLQQCHPSMDS